MFEVRQDKGIGISSLVGVEVDKEKFRSSVKAVLDVSPVWATVKLFPKFSIHELPTYWRLIVQAGEMIISAVEISKQNILKDYPEGTKFSPQIALETAAKILDESIQFTGVGGRLLDTCDGYILKLLINIVFGNRGGLNWTSEAFNILKLAIGV